MNKYHKNHQTQEGYRWCNNLSPEEMKLDFVAEIFHSQKAKPQIGEYRTYLSISEHSIYYTSKYMKCKSPPRPHSIKTALIRTSSSNTGKDEGGSSGRNGGFQIVKGHSMEIGGWFCYIGIFSCQYTNGMGLHLLLPFFEIGFFVVTQPIDILCTAHAS